MQLSPSLDGNCDVLDAPASKCCQLNGTYILFKLSSLATEEYPHFIYSLKVLYGLQVWVEINMRIQDVQESTVFYGFCPRGVNGFLCITEAEETVRTKISLCVCISLQALINLLCLLSCFFLIFSKRWTCVGFSHLKAHLVLFVILQQFSHLKYLSKWIPGLSTRALAWRHSLWGILGFGVFTAWFLLLGSQKAKYFKIKFPLRSREVTGR